MPTTKEFKLEELSKYFHLPEKAVAKELGICLTSLKKLCRSYGITRWPFRKLKSIQRSLAKAQDETSVPGAQLAGAKVADKSMVGLAEGGGAGLHGFHDDHTQEAQHAGGAAAAAAAAKGRRAYQLGGKTFHLSEEEKNIVRLTLGKTGGPQPDLRPLPQSHARAAVG
eukprot:CAMPEP_0113679964 /NCGR_PEP_ID=MMETSP0038_2-20120614/10984_1 /TAXON_ID=2898 /ORGANISM="Cryptomonas paramecium" /LENGTH=167 /DNA_ID=CAMNT_0000598149 /DNA_START=273 /DNA_END=772 /DNA_ORIENTATION=- /assembly_acc=CAM_ASM_000170